MREHEERPPTQAAHGTGARIVGKAVEGRPALRYVRLPGQKRTYVVRVVDLNVSTRFEDWIERNLLQVERDDIDQIVIRNYTVDAKSGRVSDQDTLALRKRGKDLWAVDGAEANRKLDDFFADVGARAE